MDVETFVEKCKDVLARRGEDLQHGCVMGYIGVKNRCYEDDIITIASATHNGKDLFEITVKYKTDSNGKEIEIENPCIMIQDGDMFRCHGDWRRAADHIETM
jgi:hypothetical protein